MIKPAGRVVTVLQSLSAHLPSLLRQIANFGTLHVHHTHVGYSDDPEMQETIKKRKEAYPDHATHSHDPHSLQDVARAATQPSLIVIDNINLLLSNLYLLNNKQDDQITAAWDAYRQILELIRETRSCSPASTILLLSSDVSGDHEARTAQGLSYQRLLSTMNAQVVTRSDLVYILTGSNLIPLVQSTVLFQDSSTFFKNMAMSIDSEDLAQMAEFHDALPPSRRSLH